LLDRKLVTTAGRKNVIGRPILYRTTRDFLKQFGLSGLDELPSIEEFEELARAALGDAFGGPFGKALPDSESRPTAAPGVPEAVEDDDGA